MYFDLNFAQSRLNQTVITIKKRAALILSVLNHEQDLNYVDLESGEEGIINIDDKDVSLIPPKLGYIYIPNRGGFYIARQPVRRWKQGIPWDTFMEIDPFRKSIGRSLNGNYKPFRQCLRAKKVTPFHRVWAVGNGVLYYRGERVGTATPEGVTSLDEDHIHLKEYLEEVIR